MSDPCSLVLRKRLGLQAATTEPMRYGRWVTTEAAIRTLFSLATRCICSAKDREERKQRTSRDRSTKLVGVKSETRSKLMSGWN